MSQNEDNIPKFDARRFIEKAVEIEFPELPKEARDAIVESRLRQAKSKEEEKALNPADELRESKKDLFRK